MSRGAARRDAAAGGFKESLMRSIASKTEAGCRLSAQYAVIPTKPTGCSSAASAIASAVIDLPAPMLAPCDSEVETGWCFNW